MIFSKYFYSEQKSIEKSGVLSKQGELVGSHSDSVQLTGGNHRHIFYGSDNSHNDSGPYGVDTDGNGLHYNGNTYYTDYSGDLTMSGTVKHGGQENRPSNYTIRVWKRVS